MKARGVRLFGVGAALVVVVAAALWWSASRSFVVQPGSGAGVKAAVTTPGIDRLDDLLFDLQLVPLEGRSPVSFSLEGLDGARVALADFRGRPVLLYFWASW
jgi:hypothetical protein